MPLTHKFIIEYIFINDNSPPPFFVGVALGGVALKCTVPQLPISTVYKAIWMKSTPFSHIFLMEYIFINCKSATPLLVGVALGGVALEGVALKCSVPQLPISAVYKAICMKPTPFSHIFLIEYIFINCHTPFIGCGNWGCGT